MRLGVVGAGTAGPELEREAEAVGREVARSGATLYCGGLGGVMLAAARGARAEGGVTIGILPGSSALDANPFITHPIVTGMGQARNVILVGSCDAIIAVGGGYGTLSEVAVARKLGIPVIGLGSWRLDEGRGSPIRQVSEPAEAVAIAVSMIRQSANRREG